MLCEPVNRCFKRYKNAAVKKAFHILTLILWLQSTESFIVFPLIVMNWMPYFSTSNLQSLWHCLSPEVTWLVACALCSREMVKGRTLTWNAYCWKKASRKGTVFQSNKGINDSSHRVTNVVQSNSRILNNEDHWNSSEQKKSTWSRTHCSDHGAYLFDSSASVQRKTMFLKELVSRYGSSLDRLYARLGQQ